MFSISELSSLAVAVDSETTDGARELVCDMLLAMEPFREVIVLNVCRCEL